MQVAFIQTSDEQAKGAIEKAFLRNGISYLVRIDQNIMSKIRFLKAKKKYAFYINRFQIEEADELMNQKEFEEFCFETVYK